MFSSSQFDGNLTFSQSTDSGVSPAKKSDAPGTIPVTLKAISEASHSGDEKANFMVGGTDVTNVSVVGMVARKLERITDVSFTLDDGTGRIDCNRWVNDGYETKEMSVIEDGIYVRVNGRLRSFQGKKQIVAFSVRPVTNFDEVTYHFIECLHFHLQNSRMQQGDTSTQTETANSALNTPSQKGINGSNVYQSSTPVSLALPLSVDGLKGFDQMVLEFLQLPSNFQCEKGVHTDAIRQALKIPLEKIMESISTLEGEGLIYSTIDEFHYKATTCG